MSPLLGAAATEVWSGTQGRTCRGADRSLQGRQDRGTEGCSDRPGLLIEEQSMMKQHFKPAAQIPKEQKFEVDPLEAEV